MSPGVYVTCLSPGWAIGQALNGGYLLAVVGRALSEALPHSDPFTVTAHYLSATTPGPATVRTNPPATAVRSPPVRRASSSRAPAEPRSSASACSPPTAT